MNVIVDEATGYLIVDEIEEGIEILPTALYQGYLKQIKDLQEKVSDLQDKLAHIAVAQADANVLAEKARLSQTEVMKIACQTERGMGVVIGLYCAKNGKTYPYAQYYSAVFDELYNRLANDENSHLLDEIEAKYKYLLPENS